MDHAMVCQRDSDGLDRAILPSKLARHALGGGWVATLAEGGVAAVRSRRSLGRKVSTVIKASPRSSWWRMGQGRRPVCRAGRIGVQLGPNLRSESCTARLCQ